MTELSAPLSYAQSDILLTLAYLMGERSVNATTSGPRADFIQSTLQEAYSKYPWTFARSLATVVFSNGIATLPTNYDASQPVHIIFNDGQSKTINEIHPDDEELFGVGDNAAWIRPTAGGVYVLRTNDTTLTAVSFKYQAKAPLLDTAGTVTTPYPNKHTIALGARRWVKLGQNPDADISQDDAIFQKALSVDIAANQVPAPRKTRRTINNSTGDF